MARNYYGTVLPLFAMLLTIILGFGTLAIDFSQGYATKANVKNAVDFACLAGISQFKNQSSTDIAKNTALQYLNDNLSKTIPSFTPLTLGSSDLTIKIGVYDSSAMTFTWDELNPNANAMKISYKYNASSYLGNVFMISNLVINESSTVAKQIAAKALPGSGFPMVIYSTALDEASNNGNMVTLYTGTMNDNSYWTDYTSSNPSTTDIKNVLDYFQYGMGTTPPGISINDTFNVNDGSMGGAVMDMDPNILIGMTYLFSVVTPTMDTQVMADGFIGATINNIVDSMGQKSVAITIVPGYINDTFGGLQIGSEMTSISSSNQTYLANGFGLVE